ncbi:helix-turn-helix domain-containing protein [Flavobacterium sp. '19STA2R22 D10 B1']|uniref:helix-turn-helix domain-containing protein n=1 Tax=Flavobacterium aerium TaxID=3037261 RepID=UPI00278C0929|nr:XRE family transcriptional regulator [Flavobacterium sp. '19STA2R22 D10 B1']
MDDYLIGIGKRIKEIRKNNKKTISEIADQAAVSNGLISKIENGRTIPSLPVLLNIISALEIDVSLFFEPLALSQSAPYIVTRAAEHTLIEKEIDAKGFTYHHIFSKQIASLGFEAVLLTVDPQSHREKVETDAYEFKYVLNGSITYSIGENEVTLDQGDSLFFDGRIPHVPINNSSASCTMLVLYFFMKTE